MNSIRVSEEIKLDLGLHCKGNLTIGPVKLFVGKLARFLARVTKLYVNA